MPSSKFRFESLLKIRESIQSEKKNSFLDAQRLLQKERDGLAELERLLEIDREEAKAARAVGALDANSLRRRQAYRTALGERRDEAERRVREALQESERRRAELDEAIKETKILQKLKEKRENERLETERRRAEKEADETATRQKIFEKRQERSNDDE